MIRDDFDAIHQIVKDERERREKKKLETSALNEVEADPVNPSFDFAQDEDT